MAVKGHRALLLIPPQPSYDYGVLVLYWPADLDLSSCSNELVAILRSQSQNSSNVNKKVMRIIMIIMIMPTIMTMTIIYR